VCGKCAQDLALLALGYAEVVKRSRELGRDLVELGWRDLQVDEIADEGFPIRFVHSTLVADEESAFCVFEAESAVAVEEAYARAGVPFERVLDALQIGTGPETHRLPGERATTAA
jgi:hypothetical protein